MATVKERRERASWEDAADKVALLYGTAREPEGNEHHSGRPPLAARVSRERASALVTDAVRHGASAEEIAAAAGVRQILVAQLIADEAARAKALRTALCTAQRELDEVTEAIRVAAGLAVTEGMSYGGAAEMYGVEWASPEWAGEAVVSDRHPDRCVHY